MKKILLVLAMIAASVFLAQPAIAEGETGDTVATSETAPETTEVVQPEEPPPVAAEEPAQEAPAAEVPAATPVADPEPADAGAGDEPGDDSSKKGSADKQGSGDDTTSEGTEAGVEVVAAPASKVWVCKYVGKPGEDERLKAGKNPIEVSANALPGKPDNPQVGDSFNDAQGRSYVVQVGGSDPGVGACPGGDEDTVVDTEDPIVSPGTCEEAGALTLPDTPGVLYTVTPNYTGQPGTYDVTASALDGYVLSDDSETEWNDLVVEDQDDPEDCVTNPDVKKVWVCKYVGKPGVDEVLKGGKNPIEVSINALPGSPDNVQVGDDFSDAQERSHVVALSPADPEPTIEDCLAPIQPTEITAEAPIADPATCDADGSLVLPDTDNVVYTVEPEFVGPGDYTVTATVASDDFVLIGQTVFEVTVGGKLPTADCVTPDDGDDGNDDPAKEEDDLLPDTGGLPLWVLLLAGPMTAAGLIVLMRREPVSHASTGGGMPSYSLILPPVSKPAKVQRAHASTEHIGFMQAVGKVVAAIGSFLRGGRR